MPRRNVTERRKLLESRKTLTWSDRWYFHFLPKPIEFRIVHEWKQEGDGPFPSDQGQESWPLNAIDTNVPLAIKRRADSEREKLLQELDLPGKRA